jgi:hypothetical protein
MACWEAYRKRRAGLKPIWRVVDLFASALAGASYGIGMTFGWRTFHRPLVFFMVAPLVAIPVALLRRRRFRRKIREAS